MTVKTNYLENVLGESTEAKMAIREIPLFQNCSEKLLEMIYKYGKVVDLSYGEELIREGEFDQWVFFIISGRLAVYVGSEKVDVINSSLAGERCILGEPRKASLKAEEEGLKALGIDMAILDAFSKEPKAKHEVEEKITPYIELLAMISSEIINRIAELWYNQIEVRRKFFFYLKAKDIATIMHKLYNNLFQKNKLVNLIIYRFISTMGDSILLKYCDIKRLNIDTRMICIHCNNTQNEFLLEELAEQIFNQLLVNHAERLDSHKNIQLLHLSDLSKLTYAKIREKDLLFNQISETDWKNFFHIGKTGRIDIKTLCLWLTENLDFDEEKLVEMIMFLIEESSKFTAEINLLLQFMLGELDQIKSFKKDEKIVSYSGDIHELVNSLPLENLIPILQMYVLQTHLVDPYYKKINSKKEVEVQPKSDQSDKVDSTKMGEQAVIDALLKQLEK